MGGGGEGWGHLLKQGERFVMLKEYTLEGSALTNVLKEVNVVTDRGNLMSFHWMSQI